MLQALFRLGTKARVRHSRVGDRSNGVSTGCRDSVASPPRQSRRRVVAGDGRHRRLRLPDRRYALCAAASEQLLTFPSALETPHPANNTVHCRVFHARENPVRAHRAAVLVLPQWNSDAGGHVGLCRLLTMNGLTAVRLSLPYHDLRMPPELLRADYIVSSNIVRTLQVCRQAVLDARRAIAWLHAQGYDRIGILGSSLGSCLSLLTTAHEPLVRPGTESHLAACDAGWRAFPPRTFVRADSHRARFAARAMAADQPGQLHRARADDDAARLRRYDLTFPVDLSQGSCVSSKCQNIPHESRGPALRALHDWPDTFPIDG